MTDSEHLAAFLAWLRDVRQDYDMALAELDEAENAPRTSYTGWSWERTATTTGQNWLWLYERRGKGDGGARTS